MAGPALNSCRQVHLTTLLPSGPASDDQSRLDIQERSSLKSLNSANPVISAAILLPTPLPRKSVCESLNVGGWLRTLELFWLERALKIMKSNH